MSIKQILFSDNNVDDVVDYILDKYDMEDNSRGPVEEMLRALMKPIYMKNQDKLEHVRGRDAARKYVMKINQKAVEEFAKEYDNHQSKGRGGGRNNKRGNSQNQRRGRGGGGGGRGAQPMDSGNGDSSYAPVANGRGGYITATGEMGDSMFFGNLQEQMYQQQMSGMSGSGLSPKDDIERQMLMRQAEYEGMNPYATGMGYGMNPMMGNQRPPEINFCVDGGDTRGIANGDAGQGMGGMGMTMGMNSMGMDDMGSANAMQNGMFGSLNGDGMATQNMMGMMGMMGNPMNPMMGMGGMPGQGMNMMGMGSKSGGDFESRLAMMEAERGGHGIEGMSNINMQNMQNMPNMPNMSNMQGGNNPQMMQMMAMFNALQQQIQNGNNNGSGFRAGGRAGTSEMQNRIRDSKNELAYRYDLDPEVLANMSPQQIKELLEGNDSDSDSDSDSESSASEESGMNLREKILAKFRDKKKKMEKENEKFGKEVSKVKSKIKKNVKSDDLSESESDSASESSEKPKKKQNKITAKKVESKKVTPKKVDKTKNKGRKQVKSESNNSSSNSDVSDSESADNSSNRSSDNSSDKSSDNSSDHSSNQSSSSEESRRHKNNRSKQTSKQVSKSSNKKDSISTNKSAGKSTGKSTINKGSNALDTKDQTKSNKTDRNNVMIKKKSSSDKNARTSVTSNTNDEDLHELVVKIDSKSWTEADFLSEYHIDLDESISNIRRIEIEGRSDFPMMKPVIDESNNILCLIEQGDSIPIEVESGDNTHLQDIIDEINSGLDGADIPIEIIEDKDAHIVIRSTSKEKFGLDFREKSIAPCFGFTEEEYDGAKEYRSENQHVFLNQSYYLFIEEISNQPICEISPEGDVTLLIEDINLSDLKTRSKSSSKISGLTLIFRYDTDPNSDLVDFYGEHHKINFRFMYAAESSQKKGQDNKNVSNKKSNNTKSVAQNRTSRRR